MKKEILLEKYPVFTLEIAKEECRCGSIGEIVDYFKERIESDPTAAMIGLFDHYAHTRALGGEIAPHIVAARNVIFCFGPKLPDVRMLAVRPRSIGIVESADAFFVTFLEAPMQPLHEKMERWAKDLAVQE